MGPGPVFRIELITGARRARYFVLRAFYVLILLWVVGQAYTSMTYTRRFGTMVAGGDTSEMTIAEMSRYAYNIFTSILVVQVLAVICLTPAMVAGVIADERRRKTLHYLLASQLSSGEIVLGKLFARLLHIAVFVALGLPVLSLLTLFGGVDPRAVAISAVCSMSLAYFLGGLSILVSTTSKNSREAVSISYLLLIAGLVMPTMIEQMRPLLTWPWNWVYECLRPINDWLRPISPLSLLTPTFFRGRGQYVEALAWMVVLQLVYGSVFVLLAVLRLRPGFRKEGGPSRVGSLAKRLARARRFLPRPACGDDAMLWKERFVARTSGLAKGLVLLVALGIAGVVIATSYDLIKDAALEAYFLGSAGGVTSARQSLNVYLRVMSGFATAGWLLAVGAAAISSEREGDTWISLMSTPIGRHEVLRAKLVGSVWSILPLPLFMIAYWAIGLATGSVHPFGAAAAFLELCLFTAFAATLGLYFSLTLKSSAKSLAATIGTMIFLNGAYMLLCIPAGTSSMEISAGCGPFLVAMTLMTPTEFTDLWRLTTYPGRREYGEIAAASVVGSLWYGAGAALMCGLSYARFDEMVDRPRRF
jgi:ABC-type transport system involved in multi-copper enzyme maturation permease subunit